MRQHKVYTPYIAFLIACIITFAFFIAHKSANARGQTDFVTASVRKWIIVPSGRLKEKIGRQISAEILTPKKSKAILDEDQHLRQRISDLEAENSQLHGEAVENDRLRKMLDLPSPRMFKRMSASLIALKPFSSRDTAIVEFGSDIHGAMRDVIIDPSGNLVGQITSANGSICDVLLLTDSNFSAGARVLPTGRPSPSKIIIGICQGARSDQLLLTDLPIDSDVQPGDNVETSGLGSVFPPNIPIGKVISVQSDPIRSLKTAVVECTTDTNGLYEVYALR